MGFCTECRDERALPQWFDSVGVYYGYIILVVGTIGVCSSMPGQTVGISVFSDAIMHALELSRSQLSFAYLCGTISSAFLLPKAGKFLDSLGPRLFTTSAALCLTVCVVYFSFCDVIYQVMKGIVGKSSRAGIDDFYVAFAVAYVGFICIRQFGQGWLTMGSRTMMASFWEKRRGRMMAFSGVGVAFVFGITPVLFEMLITNFGWRHSLRYFLGPYLLGFAVIAFSFFRRNPEDCGLIMDGETTADNDLSEKEASASSKRGVSFTAEQAIRTRSFWIYAAGLCSNALIVTANTFHISYTAKLNGVSQQRAFSVFIPAAIISTSTDIVAGFLQDFVDMRVLLALMNLSMVVFLLGIATFDQPYGWWLMAIGQGIGGGMFAQLQGVAFPSLFGTKHLGSISGYTMALVVGGSALGPYSFTINGGGSGDKALYDRNLVLLALIPAVCLLLTPFANIPSHPSIDNSDDVGPDEGGDYELVRMEESAHGSPKGAGGEG